MDAKQIIEELGLTGGHYELTTNRNKTPIVVDTDTGEIVAKCCRKCGVVKLRKDMATDKGNKDGMKSNCLNCMKGYSAGYYANPENKKRKQEKMAEYYAIPENKKRQAEYRAVPENKIRKAETDAERQRNNPDKVAKRDAKRYARKRNLPSEDISSTSFEKCELTGATDNIHIEHFIPLAIGHGGTYFANCYAMQGSANRSKNDSNPFEWYERFGERYGITIEAWSDLIEKLASRNGMDPSEYVRFVNWCYDNPRTLEQIKADNKRYGYVVDSLTLYSEAMANMATREIA